MTTLLVGFHGGTSPESINNVVAFPDGAKPYDLLSTAIPSAVVHPLRELRKFLFSPSGDHLYVANGSKDMNQVVRFTKPPPKVAQWQYQDVYAADQLDHPFDVIYGFGTKLFVSNQDTKTVTTYATAGGGGEIFAHGFTAVRGLAFDGTYLYVADAANGPDGHVYLYDATGRSIARIAVDQPVHLLYDPDHRWLFIGSEMDNAVLAWNPAKMNTPPVVVVSKTNPKIDHTAGMALLGGAGATSTLLVVSREGHQVLSFPVDFSSGIPVWAPRSTTVVLGEKELTDAPEFVGTQGGHYG